MCQLLCEKKRSLKGADRVRQIYKIDMFPRDWLSVVIKDEPHKNKEELYADAREG
jgi:hypothetical protein